ncbi:hypothetical protein H8E88_31230 [candidate division KSB1 bacterium]|nr:hypothetical protein [candidate division KSB1 bacterium]
MKKIRKILLTVFLALFFVGITVANNQLSGTNDTSNKADGISAYMGSGKPCVNDDKWDCMHIEISFDWDLPW